MASSHQSVDPEDSALERLDAALVRVLWRADCPSPDTLLARAWQTLPAEEAAHVNAHLALCPRCRQEMALLAEAADPSGAPQPTAPPEPATPRPALPNPGRALANATRALADSAVAGMRTFIAQLAPASEPALAPLRGAAENLIYEFEAGVLILDVQPAAPGKRTLEGQLLRSDAEPSHQGGWVHLRLDDDSAPLAQPMDALGIFHFDELRPGVYSLRIEGPDFVVLVPSLYAE